MKQKKKVEELENALEKVMEISRGLMESRVIINALELDLFTAVGPGATALAAARTVGADARATEMLMNVLVTQNLLTKCGQRFALTPVAGKFLTSTSPASVRMAMMHTAGLWDSWSTLTKAVRAGTRVRRPDRTDDQTEAFIAAMHRNSETRAETVANALDLGRYQRMLDVGGGSGGYSIAFARKNAQLNALVFDLGPVTRIAERHILNAGLAERVKVREGDFRKDALGSGFDLVFLSAICHMNPAEANRDLIWKAYEALSNGGDLVIQDHILNAEKTEPKAGVLFALNMLVNTDGGASYSEEEYHTWMRDAGFGGIRTIRLPGATGLVVGTR